MATSELPHQALRTLYNEHHLWLQSWLQRRLGSAFDAADLAHDTYERLICSNRTPDHPSKSRSWLVHIAKGLVVDLHRRRRLERAYLEALAQLPERETPSVEAREIALETLMEIDAILDGVSAKAREAFLLSRLDRLTYPEIAQRLNVSTASVQKYMLSTVKACYRGLYPENARSN
jgi:RNA polymerase sigma factor (sigma-70 family)